VKRQAGQGGNSARSAIRFLYVSKTLSHDPQDSAVSLKEFSFLTKGNSNTTQSMTLTEAIPLR
jgi:hypothetical protein